MLCVFTGFTSLIESERWGLCLIMKYHTICCINWLLIAMIYGHLVILVIKGWALCVC